MRTMLRSADGASFDQIYLFLQRCVKAGSICIGGIASSIKYELFEYFNWYILNSRPGVLAFILVLYVYDVRGTAICHQPSLNTSTVLYQR